MKSAINKIYISTFLNSFGSWLTFLAIALAVKDQYGGEQVAWTFLIQTLPAILFSRGLAHMVPNKHQEKIYVLLQFGLAANCLILCFNQSLSVIYVHLFLAATMKSLSIPLFNTLIGKWFPGDGVKEIFVRIGSLQTSTLTLAPIFGAWLKVTSSLSFLFAVDAVTFILGVLLIVPLLNSQPVIENNAIPATKGKGIWESLKVPSDIPEKIWKNLNVWFVYIALGALINALEFACFERLNMSEKHIGYALAAWGLGSLAAFHKKLQISINGICIIFVASITMFLSSTNPWIAICSFGAAGWSSTILAGYIRGNIQNAVPSGYNALPVWSFTNQVTQIINLIAYAGVGALLKGLGFTTFSVLTVTIGFIILGLIIKEQKYSFSFKGGKQS